MIGKRAERDPVLGGDFIDQLSGCDERFFHGLAAHAGAGVDENVMHRRAIGCGGGFLFRREKGPGESENQQREGGAAQDQQEDVLQPRTAFGDGRAGFQKHQRGKRDGDFRPAFPQVQQDRQRDGGQSCEEQWSEESHGDSGAAGSGNAGTARLAVRKIGVKGGLERLVGRQQMLDDAERVAE